MYTVYVAVVMAFSLFSAIPMPQPEWKDDNLKYMLCALPFVGLVIGAVMMLWGYICSLLNAGSLLYGAGLTLIPVLISGGIHMDGFCDSVDALSSRAPMEKKRMILKDSHAGAFAIIFTGVYYVAFLGFAAEYPRDVKMLGLLACHQVMSRVVGAIASTAFPKASSQGMLAAFHDSASKKATGILVVWGIIAAAAGIYLCPVPGTVSVLVALICLFYIRKMSEKQFGGMSGDLAGFIITVSALLMLAASNIAYLAVNL